MKLIRIVIFYFSLCACVKFGHMSAIEKRSSKCDDMTKETVKIVDPSNNRTRCVAVLLRYPGTTKTDLAMAVTGCVQGHMKMGLDKDTGLIAIVNTDASLREIRKIIKIEPLWNHVAFPQRQLFALVKFDRPIPGYCCAIGHAVARETYKNGTSCFLSNWHTSSYVVPEYPSVEIEKTTLRIMKVNNTSDGTWSHKECPSLCYSSKCFCFTYDAENAEIPAIGDSGGPIVCTVDGKPIVVGIHQTFLNIRTVPAIGSGHMIAPAFDFGSFWSYMDGAAKFHSEVLKESL